MDTKQVKKLAHLARINVSDEDLEQVKGDLASILEYVAILEEAEVSSDNNIFHAKNVLREDENPIESGTHTDEILANAPATKDGFVKVPKIL